MTPLVLAFSLMLTAAPSPDDGGEPLPPGAPTDSYELSAWCYGALNEYLIVYEKVKPDLRDIDHMFGTQVVEDEPYQSDMAAARDELKMIGGSVTAAEKASPRPIAERGAAAMRQGQAIWSVVEGKTSRELARAWLTWALPDRCDSNARELTARSIVLGKALSYNNGPGAVATVTAAPAPQPAASSPAPSQASPPAPAFAPSPAHGTSQAAAPAETPPVTEAEAPPPAAVGKQPATPQAEEAPAPAETTAVPPTPNAPPPAVAAAPVTAPPNSDQSQEPTL